MLDKAGFSKIVIVLVIFFILGSFQQSHRVLAFRGSDNPVPIRDWTYENVEGTKDVGRYPSMAVDSEGIPHIGYYDYTNIDIRYTYWNGDSWTRETVDHLNTDYISLMLDGTTPHMLFGNYRLIYAYRNSLGWQTETIEVSSKDAFRSGSLALDIAGNPHIAYYDYGSGLYKYAHRTPSGWVIEPLRERDYAIATTSITIDQSGNPHIAFVDSFDLIYTSYTETGWDFEVVETGYPSNVAIQMDNDDHPQISYLSGNIVDELRYASKSTGIWMIETVDSVAVDITTLHILGSERKQCTLHQLLR